MDDYISSLGEKRLLPLTTLFAGSIHAAERPFNRSTKCLDNLGLRFTTPFRGSNEFLEIAFAVFETGFRRRSRRKSIDSSRDVREGLARWIVQSCAR